MPLPRYQIRNEYSLADPELFKAAEIDDPEALLEGVAMAGLVGVLRQLGDLSEFAAEVFHGLHDHVMATAARGHDLMARVQQLEAEIPSIEKAFLSQTSHTSFHSNAGVDWHPYLRLEQNLITHGELPRCVMDSYEECRGPPRLFLLDKFDVAGAGACLTRYTDPSFFKVESAHSALSVEVQREKKYRKVKKTGLRWKNGTPEFVPPSHAKLRQLFLEESVEKGCSDPARLVKLKRKQLNASPFDSRSGKSYMAKFLETLPEEVCVISVNPLPLKLTSDSATESGQEIHDVTTVSPVKRSLQDTDSTCSSPNAHEVVLKPSMDELYGKVIGRPIVKMPEPKAECERDEIPSFHQKQMVEEEIVGDGKGKPEGSVDGDNSEDMTREVDIYMDALTPMDLEMESDHDYQPKSKWGLLNVEKHEMDPEQLELEAHFSDAQSIMNFSLSDGGDSLLKKVRSSFSYSDTLSNLAEITQSDGEGSGKVFPTSEAFGPQNTEMLSDQLPGDVAALREKSNDLFLPNNMCIDEDNIHCHGDASSNYTSAGSLHPLPLLQPATSSMQDQSDETPSESTIPSSTVAYREEKYTRVDSPEVGSDLTSQNRNGTSFTAPAESHSVNKLDGEDTHLSSHDLLHLSNNSELASENKGGDDSSDEELPMDFAEKSYQDNKVNGTIGVTWSNTSPIEGRACFPDFSETEDSVVEKDDALVSEVVHDALSETGVLRETSTFIADTSQNCNFQEQRVSGMENVPQAELESVEERTVCSAEANVADIYETADSEKIGASCCKVAAVDGEAAPLELPSNCEEGLLLEDPVEINDAVVESIRAENLAFLETAADYVHAKASPDEDVDFVCPAQDLIHSPVALNSGIEDPHKEGLIFNELASPEYLAGPEAENEKTQLEVAPKDFDFSSCNLTSCYESNSDIIYGVHNSLADEIINSLPAVGEINGVHNSLASEIIHSLPAGRLIRSSGLSDQELELKSLHQTHHLDGGEDAMSLPGVHPVPETSAAQPLVLLADQLEGHLSDQIQSSNHTNKKRLSDDVSEFCQEGLARECSLSGYLQQSTGEEINYTEPEMGPLNSVLPSFGLIPEADQMNLEEMPPLPPLPPMQWRLGKTQHAPLFLQGDSRDHNPESVPLTLPFRDHEKVQSAFPAHQSDFLQPAIPFLSVIAVDDKSEHASELVDNANSQTNSHDSEGTESTNPFLTLSASPGEKPEHGFLAPEHEIVQSSSNPFLSLSADDDTASKYYSVSSPKKLIHALSQSAPEPELRHTLENLEGETGSPSDTAVLPRFEDTASNPVSSPEKLIHILGPSASEPGLHNTSESSGLEHANPSDTYVLSPVKAERAASKCDSVSLLEKSITLNRSAPEPVHGNPSYTSALSPRKAEKQPPDGLPNSEGESLLHSDPFALSATSEFGQETRGSTAKLPRPRSPLIDALAAHDKSKLRKMSERVRPQSEQKFDKRNSLLEQIRTRSFNLKPAVVSSPSIQGPKTNLRVAAILEKANAIRQATAGSDEDDEDWSDS